MTAHKKIRRLLGFAIAAALVGLALLLAGCGGGGGGGGGGDTQEKPPAPPFGLNIYSDETRATVVSSGTLTRTAEGRYVMSLEGKEASSFEAGDIRISGHEVALPIGPEGREEQFGVAEFHAGLKALEAGAETTLRGHSGLTYELKPEAAPAKPGSRQD